MFANFATDFNVVKIYDTLFALVIYIRYHENVIKWLKKINIKKFLFINKNSCTYVLPVYPITEISNKE